MLAATRPVSCGAQAGLRWWRHVVGQALGVGSGVDVIEAARN
jgi:hypothetical protein